MSGARALHWASVSESTFAGGIWVLYGLHWLFGRLPLRLIFYPVVLYYWATRPQARAASLEYLRRMEAAHHVFGRRPGWVHSLRHFRAFAETILDKTLAISGRYRFERVRYVGREMVDAMIARGEGAIMVTGHVGCLELCQAAAGRQPGLKLTMLVHTRHAERFNRILRRLDPHSPVRMLQVTEVDAGTAVLLAQRIAEGEFVAIAGDRVPVTASKTARVPFLGHEAPFPVGAYVLAALIKCPLFMLGCVREAGGHTVRFEQLAARVELPRGHRAEALDAMATEFAQRLESLLVLAPYDWFNFFSFWAQPSAAPALPLAYEKPGA
ncbi:MAG: acyltransferase [Burkholderiales bacterium]|nr:acyltransferase [Burkholderiales bacterium]